MSAAHDDGRSGTRSPRSSRRAAPCCCGPASSGGPTEASTGSSPPIPSCDDVVADRAGDHRPRPRPHRRGRRRRPGAGHDVLVPVHARRGTASPVGRTRTLPADRCRAVPPRHRVLRRATRWRRSACTGRWPSARSTSSLHLGDYIYEDDGSDGPRAHDPPHAATTLDDYRRRLAQIRADPDAQALHLRHPMVDDLGRPRPGRQRVAHRRQEARSRRARPVGRPGRRRRPGPPGVAPRPAAPIPTTR